MIKRIMISRAIDTINRPGIRIGIGIEIRTKTKIKKETGRKMEKGDAAKRREKKIGMERRKRLSIKK